MKIKLLCYAIFCAVILSSTTLLVDAQPQLTTSSELTSKTQDPVTLISSAGPVSRLVTTIQFTNGSQDQIQQLTRIINSRILHFILPLKVFSVEHLDFTITYKLPVLSRKSSFSYYTSVTDYQNGTVFNSTSLINQVHSITVKNFGGVFLFTRAMPIKPVKHTVAKFQLIGACEDITIVTT